MILVLLTVLIIGLALYETGYGATNTWLKSLRKQVVVQVSAISAFIASVHFTSPNASLRIEELTVIFGFLSMLAYIATATVQNCKLTAFASAITGGVLFPILLYVTSSFLPSIGYIDTAGSGLIHFVGGVVALVASVYTTKVLGRDPGVVVRPYSATVGFLILWAGWIAYVGIITAPVLKASTALWIHGLINMSTATAWGAAIATGYMWFRCGYVKMRTCTVGGLAGMVAISADPFSVPFWVAAIIGMIGGIAATFVYGLLRRFGVVDQSNAVSIHLLPGLIGALIVPMYNIGAHLTSQIVGLSLLFVLATSLGVIICEIHNLTKRSYPNPR